MVRFESYTDQPDWSLKDELKDKDQREGYDNNPGEK